MNKNFLLSLLCFLFLFNSCTEENSSPRPFGYYRIDFPETTYTDLDIDCPYSFEFSDRARIELKDKDKCWLNIYYPDHKATIYLTYVALDNNLKAQLDQTQKLTYEHQIKATRIDRKLIQVDSNKAYGLKYNLAGDVASNIQFYITDSSSHFLRGALYFDTYVNSDSLRPVVEHMDVDIQHLIETIEWK
jgi:gliding motility-associated lipoprotein GldD